MASLVVPTYAPKSRTLYTGHSDQSSPRPQRWGENPLHDVPLCEPWDPLARFRNNIASVHLVPLGVRTGDVESFMSPKPNHDDVGRRMNMTHNKSRRVPHRPAPAIFPRNDPDRQQNDGTYALSRPTRECLAQCMRDLYICPRAPTTFPDHTQNIKRTIRMEKMTKPGKPNPATVREPLKEYENFPYTTADRQSYSNSSLVDDQAKFFVPPIQRRFSYANDPDVKEAEGDDDVDDEEAASQEQEDDNPSQRIPVFDSLINIRARLSQEGWNLPNVYTKIHPSYADADSELPRVAHGPQEHLQPKQEMGKRPRRKKSGRKRINCDSPSLFPDQPKIIDPCKAREGLRKERIKIRYPEGAQTRIHTDCTRPLRKVRFDENPPNVYEIGRNSNYLPYSVLVREAQSREEEQEGKEEDEGDEDQEKRDDAEWGTDEMLEAGWRRNTLLPRLQIRDFRSFCHSRHHLIHVEDVPDLRDNRIYSKRMFFDGTNSSVFRG
ncbi:uncharacterized protein LOC124150680 [Haliotis rufescens]|uniref:uncharacterized protein LOC124150680 n=1 Tax=Haliotis rufescens TaxID=6454 RepID=UPI00201E8F65|nr:uncharacterized protein LOC124150680 [Haliotis rufescens]